MSTQTRQLEAYLIIFKLHRRLNWHNVRLIRLQNEIML